MTENNTGHGDGQEAEEDHSTKKLQEKSVDPAFSISKDYANTFTSPLLWVGILINRPPGSDGYKMAEAKLKQVLQTRRTYTEYRIEELNTARRIANGGQSIDIDPHLSPYTSATGAKKLDEIALSLVALGNSDLTTGELIQATVRLLAKGYGITHGEKREKRTLEIFGLEEEPTEPTT